MLKTNDDYGQGLNDAKRKYGSSKLVMRRVLKKSRFESEREFIVADES